jgi:murein DD-endopeptidase MepM/ murein hydrolase activator NlpD
MRPKKAALLAVLLVLVRPAAGFDWPLARVLLTATFGESRGDHFHAGVDLGGGEQEVHPIAAGEVVFRFEEGEDRGSVPVGLGSFLVLQHPGGVRSLYGHLETGSMRRDQNRYDVSETLGRVGATGYSLGRHLHLSIIDTEMRSLINPLAVLPPLADRQTPVLKELLLRQGREAVQARSGSSFRQGAAEVLAQLYDLREDVPFAWRMAPYRVSLYQDGREVSSLRMDGLHERLAGEGEPRLALLGSERTFGELYEAEWLMRIGEVKLLPGQTTLSLFVADYAGNESSRDFLLTVTD